MTMRTLRTTTGFLAVLALLMGTASQWARAQTMDDQPHAFVLFDQLEYVPESAERPIGLEAISWIGGDVNRLWLRAEGEQSTLEGQGEAEVEALYGRLISPYFDVVAGGRLDRRWGAGNAKRGFLAVGVQGLAPYRFEIEPTLYVSHEGDVSAAFAAGYHVLFTQRLILESELETSAALQEVPSWGVGSGVNDLGIGFRLRYEFHRKVAPYVGYDYEWTFGETAEMARAAGAETGHGAFVFGIRLWR